MFHGILLECSAMFRHVPQCSMSFYRVPWDSSGMFRNVPSCSVDFYDLLLYFTWFSLTLSMELSFLLPF